MNAEGPDPSKSIIPCSVFEIQKTVLAQGGFFCVRAPVCATVFLCAKRVASYSLCAYKHFSGRAGVDCSLHKRKFGWVIEMHRW